MPENSNANLPRGLLQNDARRLLIVGCSARKHPAAEPVAALRLYDGVAFRVLRRAEREGCLSPDVDIVILSARYGLLGAEALISLYEERLTPQRAHKQAASNAERLIARLEGAFYREVFLCMGATYRMALQPYELWLPSHVELRVSKGGIGQQLQQLKGWLNALPYLPDKNRC